MADVTLTFDITGHAEEKLRQEADQLGISMSALAQALLSDLLAGNDARFAQVSEDVIRRNAELYQRLDRFAETERSLDVAAKAADRYRDALRKLAE